MIDREEAQRLRLAAVLWHTTDGKTHRQYIRFTEIDNVLNEKRSLPGTEYAWEIYPEEM